MVTLRRLYDNFNYQITDKETGHSFDGIGVGNFSHPGGRWFRLFLDRIRKLGSGDLSAR